MQKLTALLTLLCVGQLFGMELNNPMLNVIKSFLGITYTPTNNQQLNVIEENKNAKQTLEILERENIEQVRQTIAESENFEQALEAIKKIYIPQVNSFNILPQPSNNFLKFIQIAHTIAHKYTDLQYFTKLIHVVVDKASIEIGSPHIKGSTHIFAKKFNNPAAVKYIKLGTQLLASIQEDWQSKKDEITQLINDGADVNFNSDCITPLYVAIDSSNFKGALFLLDAGAIPLKEHEYKIKEDLDDYLKRDKYNTSCSDAKIVQEKITEAYDQ